jgi:hypothetical protein
MLVDRYLQRSEWLSILYGTFYIYVHEEFVEDCLRMFGHVGPAGVAVCA